MKKVLLLSKRNSSPLEMVTNGTFDTDSNWNKGTGWSISGGKAVGTAASGNLWQDAGLTNGTTYRVTYTISNINASAIRCNLGGGIGTPRSTNGTFTENIVSSVNSLVTFDPSGNFTGDLDDVSVKEIL